MTSDALYVNDTTLSNCDSSNLFKLIIMQHANITSPIYYSTCIYWYLGPYIKDRLRLER